MSFMLATILQHPSAEMYAVDGCDSSTVVNCMNTSTFSNDFTLTIKNEVVSHSQLFLAVHQIEYYLPGNHELRFMRGC